MSQAQDCIEYPEIDGAPCFGNSSTNCVPSGWTGFGGTTPDIIDDSVIHPNGICEVNDLSGLSPAGGNMSLFLSLPTGYAEGMETTVSGLDTNTEYSFGVYWEMISLLNCNSGDFIDGDLLITVDGMDFSFSGADSWELAEICIMPSSSTIDIVFQIDNAAMGAIVVDSPLCSELTPCCTLQLDVNVDQYSICPGESFFMDTGYSGGAGSVNIEWTCDPPEGLNYLSAIDEISPEFSFPPLVDFNGEVYKFTLLIEDDACVKVQECIEVEVMSSSLPEFDVDLCDFDLTADLPDESIDGYFGSWTGDFNIEFSGGTFVIFTFTLNPGQDNCLQSYDYDFFVEEGQVTSFNLNTEFCVDDNTDYSLPNISEENIFGDWFPDSDFNPSDLGVGTHSFQFIPLDDECASIYDLDIVVASGIPISFDLPVEYCTSSNPVILPSVSDDGVIGFWSMDVLDLSNPVQNNIVTFTPDNLNDCTVPFDYQYSVVQNTIPTFNLNTEFCVDDNTDYSLPNISEENVFGDWIPDGDFNPSDLGDGTHSFQFIPYPDECATIYDLDIIVFLGTPISFDLPAEYCTSANPVILPSVSDDGVFGFWSMDVLDLSNPVQNNIVTFTPDNLNDCTVPFDYEYSVVQNITPTFNLPNNICRIDQDMSLNPISIEGNNGSWNPDVFNPILAADEIAFIWTPDNPDQCISMVELVIPIIEVSNLNVSIPDTICVGNVNYNLPTIDTVLGNWNMDVVNLMDNVNSQVTVQFNVDESECFNVFIDSFFVAAAEIPEFNIPDSYCSNEASFVLPDISDNSISGTWNFSTVDPSQQDFLEIIFIPNSSACTDPYIQTLFFTDIVDPFFDLPISICQGAEVLTFSPTSVNGVTGTWTESELDPSNFVGSTFSNSFIPEDPACYSSLTININLLSFDNLMIIETDPTGCTTADGLIEITGHTSNMQMSVDNGMNWTTITNLENLQSGLYEIQIRFSDLVDCIETFTVQLNNSESPFIQDLIETHVNSCIDNNGSILCLADGMSLEYSIDGLNWQSSNLFEDLAQGDYVVYVRIVGANDCETIASTQITGPAMVEIVSENIEHVTACLLEDGMIQINSTGDNLEYSIDNGVTWTMDNFFNNLQAGQYMVLLRDMNNPDCADSLNFEILAPELPIITQVIPTDASDCGVSDGILEVFTTATNPEFSIDDGQTWQDGSSFENLAPGSYLIHVRDKDMINCKAESSAIINSPNIPQFLNVAISDPSDCLAADAQIELVSDIVNPEYSIDGLNWQTENIFDNLEFGDYVIYVRDAQNIACENFTMVNIERPDCPCDDLDIEVELDNIPCDESNTGLISIQSINDFYTDEPYTLEWDNGDTNLEIMDLSEGIYSLTVYYDLNCSYTQDFEIEQIDTLSFEIQATDETCDELGSIEVVSLNGGSGNYQFSIDNNDFQIENNFTNLSEGIYTIEVDDFSGCSTQQEVAIDFVNDLSVIIEGVSFIVEGEIATLTPTIEGSNIYSFEWSPAEFILDPNSLIAEVAPTEATLFNLTVFNGDCLVSYSLLVDVIPIGDIEVQNIFVPNVMNFSSGENIIPLSSPSADIVIQSFNIYDRWGNLIFNAKDPVINESSTGWDGRFNGQPVVIGVYTYHLVFEQGESEVQHKLGTITVID